MNARALVLAAITTWRSSRLFADSILHEHLARSRLTGADRAFTNELFYGVLRNLTLLDFWIGRLRQAPVDAASRDLLRLGLYQLFILRTPGHAAIFETVALASARQRPLVNAILRNAQRRFAELEDAARAAPLATRESHPAFLLERWNRQFGIEATEALCRWNNTAARIYARINSLLTSVDKFLREHPTSEPIPETASFVRLAQIPLDAVAGGECYIQDPSTQFACELLDPQPGESVLDACAAPGGKTGLLADLMQNRGRIIACDRDLHRVQMLRENLERLGVLSATAQQHDWRNGALPGGELFDRILLDAPCTNTGVMRRRVDVRWRLRRDDFERLPAEQSQIIRSILPHLKRGGVLVYSTCSLEPEENELVVQRTLKEFPFLDREEERAVLPFLDHFDGSFAARFRHRG